MTKNYFLYSFLLLYLLKSTVHCADLNTNLPIQSSSLSQYQFNTVFSRQIPLTYDLTNHILYGKPILTTPDQYIYKNFTYSPTTDDDNIKKNNNNIQTKSINKNVQNKQKQDKNKNNDEKIMNGNGQNQSKAQIKNKLILIRQIDGQQKDYTSEVLNISKVIDKGINNMNATPRIGDNKQNNGFIDPRIKQNEQNIKKIKQRQIQQNNRKINLQRTRKIQQQKKKQQQSIKKKQSPIPIFRDTKIQNLAIISKQNIVKQIQNKNYVNQILDFKNYTPQIDHSYNQHHTQVFKTKIIQQTIPLKQLFYKNYPQINTQSYSITDSILNLTTNDKFIKKNYTQNTLTHQKDIPNLNPSQIPSIPSNNKQPNFKQVYKQVPQIIQNRSFATELFPQPIHQTTQNKNKSPSNINQKNNPRINEISHKFQKMNQKYQLFMQKPWATILNLISEQQYNYVSQILDIKQQDRYIGKKLEIKKEQTITNDEDINKKKQKQQVSQKQDLRTKVNENKSLQQQQKLEIFRPIKYPQVIKMPYETMFTQIFQQQYDYTSLVLDKNSDQQKILKIQAQIQNNKIKKNLQIENEKIQQQQKQIQQKKKKSQEIQKLLANFKPQDVHDSLSQPNQSKFNSPLRKIQMIILAIAVFFLGIYIASKLAQITQNNPSQNNIKIRQNQQEQDQQVFQGVEQFDEDDDLQIRQVKKPSIKNKSHAEELLSSHDNFLQMMQNETNQ